jgi:hypothetical protein
MSYHVAVVMRTTGNLKLKGIARKRQEHGLCYLLYTITTPDLFSSGKDDSRGQCT